MRSDSVSRGLRSGRISLVVLLIILPPIGREIGRLDRFSQVSDMASPLEALPQLWHRGTTGSCVRSANIVWLCQLRFDTVKSSV